MAAIIHRMKRGESVFTICLTYGLDYQQFAKLNARFMGYTPDDLIDIKPGSYIAVGDTADPVDLVRLLARRKPR